IEIGSEKETRPARHRHPQLRRGARLREWRAVGTGDAGARPCRVGAAAAGGCTVGADFVAPVFAAMILAAIDEKARGRAERIVRFSERRYPAVMVVVDADIEPDLRHPL